MSIKYTTLTIKLSTKLRNEAKRTAKQMGIPLTTAATILFRRFTEEKELILSAKRPKPEVLQAIRDLRAGKGKVYRGSAREIFDKVLAE